MHHCHPSKLVVESKSSFSNPFVFQFLQLSPRQFLECWCQIYYFSTSIPRVAVAVFSFRFLVSLWNEISIWIGIRKCRSFQFRLESDPLITISVLCGLFSMLAQKIGDKDLMQPPKTQIVQVCSHSSQSPMTNLFSSHGWVSFMISTNYKAGRKSSCFEQNWKPWEICFLQHLGYFRDLTSVVW